MPQTHRLDVKPSRPVRTLLVIVSDHGKQFSWKILHPPAYLPPGPAPTHPIYIKDADMRMQLACVTDGRVR